MTAPAVSLPAESLARYGRHVLVAEIGADGQARVLGASARVAAPAGARQDPVLARAFEIAALYAARAGFSSTSPGVIGLDALAPEALVRDPHARAALAGARLALAELRRVALAR
jgi:hypothetical protein